ncbi:hypothetical protein Cme02nite_74020 [Catellatospora methionotrophica]|uniref:Tissue inhibitor of metalloproteinase n=1 Tax=Catellatospora methionotrophica TaxID=121620 RepID=A0A8J3LIV7_9ACTN|nr:hypothetical protein [Catellatospora methionotrophica]GIG19070.1 hypothetical protein Cme02nite_74020 [Catellatospora methionotrophica]
MKPRAAILLVLASLVTSLVVVLSPADPAWACSCVYNPVEQDERAERTVNGTVTEVTDTAIRLAVDTVTKGDAKVGDTLTLRVARSEASCGYEFRVGARYRVNANRNETGLCIGAYPLAAMPPAPAATTAVPVAAPMMTPAFDRPSPWWFVPGALLLVAAGLITLSLRGRRGSAG